MNHPNAPTLRLPCVAPEAVESPHLQRVIAEIDALDPDESAPPIARSRALALVGDIAARLDPTGCDGHATEYARCVLHEDPTGWSLAAIVLRPGQSTPAHDHGGWGGAVTVQGVERDVRIVNDDKGETQSIARDYPPGSGYLFAPDDVHQPIGADPGGATISLHFLARADPGRAQHHHEALPHVDAADVGQSPD